MCPTTKPNRMTPVTAMTIFFAIVEAADVDGPVMPSEGSAADRGIRNEMRSTSASCRLIARREHLRGRLDQLLRVVGRPGERPLLVVGEADLDDLLDAAATDADRHADVETAEPVLALEVRGARQDLLPI